MVKHIIDLLIELATTPNLSVSKNLFEKYQITDEITQKALLNGDAETLKKILDPQRFTLRINNHTTVFTIAGSMPIVFEKADPPEPDPLLVKLSPQVSYQLSLIDQHGDIKYYARTKSGELGVNTAPAEQSDSTNNKETPT